MNRSAAICRHVRMAMRHAGQTWETLAAATVEHYHQHLALAEREVTFHTGGDAAHDMRANAQLLRRWFNPDAPARLPADVEESVVHALPEPHQSRCVAELARRYGLLAVRVPAGGVCAATDNIGRLFKETGEAAAVLARMLEDGQLGPEDAPLAAEAVGELDDVIATASELQERVRVRTEPGDDPGKREAARRGGPNSDDTHRAALGTT